MSYQVLARKWRPKTFAELSGQEHVVRALANALDRGRLHHAYLLTGTRGVGKTTIARLFAPDHGAYWLVAALASGVTAACLFVPGLKRLFEFGTPTPASLAVAVAIGLAATLVFDLAKRSVTVQRILGRAALDPHPKETTP